MPTTSEQISSDTYYRSWHKPFKKKGHHGIMESTVATQRFI